ncbi:hypothetical protein [Halopseudomonas laoshanensis]|uniref:hypothetical protein n=1 Tax=Halopseudomonas laoshanensis TaxID=2268758 RepID=UPI0015B6B914|nr:hypothetical protein [Halopseudomonas laoshanensis]
MTFPGLDVTTIVQDVMQRMAIAGPLGYNGGLNPTGHARLRPQRKDTAACYAAIACRFYL